MHAEQSLADFLDSKWTQRVSRAAMIILGFFVPLGGTAIAYLVNDSRGKAEVAQQSADDMLGVAADIKTSLTLVQGSIRDLQADVGAVKLDAARTAGIVEQLQVQTRPARFQTWSPTGSLAISDP